MVEPMVNEELLDEIYIEKRDKMLPEHYQVLMQTVLERSEELGVDEYVEEEAEVSSPTQLSREVYEELVLDYLEDEHEKYLSVPLELLREYHMDELREFEDEEKSVVVYDPQDNIDEVVSDGDSDGLDIDPELAKVLDQIVEKSSRADTREEAIDIAVECYQPFLNDDVMNAMREIGSILLSDENTPQVQQGTEAEMVRYALTALIATFNKEAQKQTGEAPAETAQQEVQNDA